MTSKKDKKDYSGLEISNSLKKYSYFKNLKFKLQSNKYSTLQFITSGKCNINIYQYCKETMRLLIYKPLIIHSLYQLLLWDLYYSNNHSPNGQNTFLMIY